MDHFENKVAIVTGGASGIGRAVCEQLGQRGAIVVVADIDKDGTEQVASLISNNGGIARPAHLDVTRTEDVRKLVDETAGEHGRLDFMFNNAGVVIAGEVRDMDLNHWLDVIDVNLMGVLYGTSAAYPLMIRQGFGHIVNTASMAGLIGLPGSLPYATTKYAVVGLSTSLRAEGAGMGVKVSVVCPGFIQTGIYDTCITVNIDRENMLENMNITKMRDTTSAARAILKGVARNRPIIITPFIWRVIWWLHRLCPSLLSPIYKKSMASMRAIRLES
jgi:NAD(P)-dependent dehydrogenase (short-subunit alcohol dehydrogenase family)